MLRLLKWILLSLVGMVVVLAGVGMLLPPKFVTERNISIDAPPDRIYPLLVDPRRWPDWTVWNQRDPAMVISYSGAASGAGAVWAWQSKTEGDGRMTFTAAEPNQRLAYELFFPDWETTSRGELQLQPQGARTQVRWSMAGDMGANPLSRWMGLFVDVMIGKDLEAGLQRLKALAEKP